MTVLFLMITTDGWTDFMFMMVDSAGIKQVPITDNSPLWAYFTLLLIVISNFLILNFYAGVLMDTFSHEKNKLAGLHSLSTAQQNWLDLQAFIIHQDVASRVRKPRHGFLLRLFKLWNHRVWTIISNCLIMLGAMSFWLIYHRQNPKFELALKVLQAFTFFFFFLEILLKLVTYGKQSYRQKSLLFDLALVLIEGVGATD